MQLVVKISLEINIKCPTKSITYKSLLRVKFPRLILPEKWVMKVVIFGSLI